MLPNDDDRDEDFEIVQKYSFPDDECCIVYDLDDEQHIVFNPEPN